MRLRPRIGYHDTRTHTDIARHRHSAPLGKAMMTMNRNGSAALRSADVVRSSEMDRSHHMRAYALDPSSARRPATKGPCRARRTGYLVLDPNLWAVAACARCPGVLPSYPATPGSWQPLFKGKHAQLRRPRTAHGRGGLQPVAVY